MKDVGLVSALGCGNVQFLFNVSIVPIFNIGNIKLDRIKRFVCYIFMSQGSWKSHATLTLLAKQDLPTFGYNMIDPLKSWCWGSILFYPFKISRFS